MPSTRLAARSDRRNDACSWTRHEQAGADVLVDHAGMEILDEDECRALLASADVARVAFVEEGAPTVLPINIGWWQRDLVFSTERGSKLEAAVNHHTVAIEVDDWDPVARTGWSVLVKGTASLVKDGREI